jgi:hypothetical protein
MTAEENGRHGITNRKRLSSMANSLIVKSGSGGGHRERRALHISPACPRN